jgi:drug/metabolite transporter (DMT)-like permease
MVFGLSFAVSGAMWALYTRALARAPSAIQANVVNTAANFVAAALLGLALFGESLPPLWWAGAGLLVAGTVMIGRRSDGKAKGD